MLIREFGLAVIMLTRVPAGRLTGSTPLSTARAVWAFPVVGAGIGAVSGLVLMAGQVAGLPTSVAAVWAVGAAVLIGGGLHEDGTADIADGFGGGDSIERKLAIMRDSRIGSYGTIALVLTLAVRIFSIAALAGWPVSALVAVGALSRGSMAIPLLMLKPARPNGLGAMMVGAGRRRWICLLVSAGIALAMLPVGTAVAVAAATFGAAAVVSWMARGQIGGFTGDVLGGCAVAAECAGLTALVCT